MWSPHQLKESPTPHSSESEEFSAGSVADLHVGIDPAGEKNSSERLLLK